MAFMKRFLLRVSPELRNDFADLELANRNLTDRLIGASDKVRRQSESIREMKVTLRELEAENTRLRTRVKHLEKIETAVRGYANDPNVGEVPLNPTQAHLASLGLPCQPSEIAREKYGA